MSEVVTVSGLFNKVATDASSQNVPFMSPMPGAVKRSDLTEHHLAFNKAVNRGDFESALTAETILNDALMQRHECSLNDSWESLKGLIEDEAGRSELKSAISESLYSSAMMALLGAKDYAKAEKQFSKTFDLVESFAIREPISFDLCQRMWRAKYHVGLAQFFAGKFDIALAKFDEIATLDDFESAVDFLEQRRLCQSADPSSSQFDERNLNLTSDVVSGVLFYSAECLLKLNRFEEALLRMRCAAAISGNEISAGIKTLAETRLPEFYTKLIKNSSLGRSSPMSTSARVSVLFKNSCTFYATRSSFEIASGKSKASSVTAMVPVYNGSKLLRHTIENILKQSKAPSEIIIVDDGSEDASYDLILSLLNQYDYPCDVIVIRTMNGGQSRARNIGALCATSELLAYLDQDDLWYADHLKVLIKPLKKDRSLGWTYSNLDEINLDGKMLHNKFLHVVAPNRRFFTIRDLLQTDMFILPSASVIRKSALVAINGFDEELSGYEDDDLFVRLFREGYCHEFIDEPLSQWRIHPGSCSYQMRMVISRRKFQKKLSNMYPNDPAMGRFWVRDFISPRFFANGANRYDLGLELGDMQMCTEALEDMKESLKTMSVPIRTRLKLMICSFPLIYKRIQILRKQLR